MADVIDADIRAGLTAPSKWLPSRLLYDALGSALFDAICQLPWYPITRAELGLLERDGAAMLAGADNPDAIIELGPGNGSKLATLLEQRGGRPTEAHLIDLSRAALAEAEYRLSRLQGVSAKTYHADYLVGLDEALTKSSAAANRLILFLGSNIGNFVPADAVAFLQSIRAQMRAGDSLLVAFDLIRDESRMLAAYDDPLGVTAAFDRNVLVNLARITGAAIDVTAFAHRARWNAGDRRIEMHLEALRDVAFTVGDVEVNMQRGETIWTESSCKYGVDSARALVVEAGFSVREMWVEDGILEMLVSP